MAGLEGCHVCTRRGICKWFADVSVSNLGGPSFDYRVGVTDFMTKTLPDHCNNFDEEVLYETRDHRGVLYNRKPLVLWYPNQKPKEHSTYCWCRDCYYDHQRKVGEYYREHPYTNLVSGREYKCTCTNCNRGQPEHCLS